MTKAQETRIKMMISHISLIFMATAFWIIEKVLPEVEHIATTGVILLVIYVNLIILEIDHLIIKD